MTIQVRNLKNGATAPAYAGTTVLQLETHAPTKYRIIDYETGEIWLPVVNDNDGEFLFWTLDHPLMARLFPDRLEVPHDQKKVLEVLIAFVVILVIWGSAPYLPFPYGGVPNAPQFIIQCLLVAILTGVSFRLGGLVKQRP